MNINDLTYQKLYLIKGASDRWTNNEPKTEKRFETGKGRGHIVRKFFGDNGETRGEKSRISQGFDNPDDEGKHDKGVVAVDLVEEAKKNGTGATDEDATFEK